MSFEFTSDLETGNSLIDHEHRTLIDAVNKLLEACSNGKGQEELVNSVKFLANYIKTHFAHEEELQVKHNYGNYDAHKTFHDQYVETMSALAERIINEGANGALLVKFNGEVSKLITHIKLEDSKLARHIKSS